jgi:hypothetical protein
MAGRVLNMKVVLVALMTFLPAGMAVAQTDDAQYVSDTIPATMIPGHTYSVSVTMKNTGTTTWTKAEGYKLGAVGDSDPFAGGRHDLSDSDAIAPGQSRTFSFTMTAPVLESTYTTDWRMVHEGVRWFGDTLTKQVQVTPATRMRSTSVTTTRHPRRRAGIPAPCGCPKR